VQLVEYPITCNSLREITPLMLIYGHIITIDTLNEMHKIHIWK